MLFIPVQYVGTASLCAYILYTFILAFYFIYGFYVVIIAIYMRSAVIATGYSNEFGYCPEGLLQLTMEE